MREHSALSSVFLVLNLVVSIGIEFIARGLSTTFARRMTIAFRFMDSTGGEHGEKTEHGGLVHG